MRHLHLRTIVGVVGMTALALVAGTGPAQAAVPHLGEAHVFTPADAQRAGYSVDLVGDYALYTVAQGSTVAVSHRTGAGDDTWQTALLEHPGGADTSYFGEAVALNETADRVFVTAPREQTIYSWSRSGANTWTIDRTYPAPTAFPRISSLSTSFGQALALSGDRLLVGAPNAVVDGKISAGTAFVLDVSGGPTDGEWTALLPDVGDVIERGIAGQSVALDGTVAVIGIPQRTVGGYRVGGVYRYDLAAGGAPTLVGPATGPSVCFPTSSSGGPSFGISVALSDGLLVVGSPVEGNQLDGSTVTCTNQAVLDGDVTVGAVYRYDDDLHPVGGKLLPPPGRYDYGYTVAVSGDLLLASAADLTDDSGRLLAYDLSLVGTDATRPEPVQELAPSDSAPSDGFGTHVYGQGPAISNGAVLVGAAKKRSGAGSVHHFRPVPASALSVPNTEAEYGQVGRIEVTVAHPVAGAELVMTVNGTDHTVPVHDGVGVLEVTGLDAAAYPVTTTWRLGGEPLATVVSVHTVTPAPTTTTLTGPATAREGDEVVVTGTLTASHGPVAGATVDIGVDDAVVHHAVTAADGGFTATLTLPAIDDAAWELTAAFPGDPNNLASAAAATTLGIAVVPTTPATPGPDAAGATPATSPDPDPTQDPSATVPSGGLGGGLLASTGAGVVTTLAGLLAVALVATGLVLRRASRPAANPGRAPSAPRRSGPSS